MMKVSDYIIQYLAKKGISHIFGYPGGMVTHLMDSVSKSGAVTSHLAYHEQGAGFAACGYAQVAQKVGVAYATSGPGATNLITPLCHAYFESIPVLFLTGQVNTHEAKGDYKVRQKGFQETDIVSMVKGVTKYSAYVESPEKIKYYLDKAFHFAQEGRPGSVLLDIPMNVQRSEVNEKQLESYEPEIETAKEYQNEIAEIEKALSQARKPVLLLGNGINSSNLHPLAKELVDQLQIPTVTSMIAVDLLSSDNENNFGFIGAYGNRWANFIISQSDLVITLGSRLDLRQTGADSREFAKEAKIIRVDIDAQELTIPVHEDDIKIQADLKTLLPALIEKLKAPAGIAKWKDQCRYYKEQLETVDAMEPCDKIRALSKTLPLDAVLTTDVGQNQVWAAQSLQIKQEQRVLFSGGHGAMGFSLPAAIGACLASGKPVYCFCGDGGFQMNIQELQTIVREQLPVKIILLNNASLGMIRHFQEMYFEGNYAYTVDQKGYNNPDFVAVCRAYGMKSEIIADMQKLPESLYDNRPGFFELPLGDTTYVYPKLVYGKPIYDQDPPISRELLEKLLTYQEK